ncbi:MAG: putative peptidoglycan binding domain, partial [Actinomycetota bacterium]
PSPVLAGYPYEAITEKFDAIAPMIYWMGNDPVHAVNLAFDRLAPLGKPIMPIGQAYDGFAEGGPAGVPSAATIERFLQQAVVRGATGASFWSWQHADAQAWSAIAASGAFRLPAQAVETLRPDQIRAFQVLLTSLGFAVPATGLWGPESIAAVTAFQSAARLKVTGVFDQHTFNMMFWPVAPPIK